MDIVKVPNKILTKKTENATLADIKNSKYADLVNHMRLDMVKAHGVGLSANQINQDLSLFVIDKNLAQDNEVPDAFFNPEITNSSRDIDTAEEGCLSIPDFFVPICRHKKIMIKAVDEHGNKIRFRARGFLARVLQHETDHLNGLTIADRARKK